MFKRKTKEYNVNFPEFHDFMKEFKSQSDSLKLILEKLYPLYTSSDNGITINSCGGFSLNLPDTVLQYTEDILGGKVIKQEGNKCIVIDKEGNVKTGLTKKEVDKGYKYKLVRN